ncbi:MAG: Apolipoprotein N-acyltransferase (EC [uncultured Sulfurovum sp.]|uniref:Apolipoprotein N-acyltransferase (EC) n=1 Tax=uncultured Sulfurovum sp. TaxID=269237 RepID=A0A6S6T508_9BACT|nr:MAG: Apolipoprotein N-acyltransferase (EC [uncultured Sulfurovum sp.]
MNKIRQYFSKVTLIEGFFIALLGSGFIYLNHWGISYPFVNTILALATLFLLLRTNTKSWFWYGAFTGILWFWWIVLSFNHYGMVWAIPIGLLVISLTYAIVFWFISKIASLFETQSVLLPLLVKSLGLLTISYLHPFGFDWLKPELMFVESYIGIEKWQFLLVLLSIVLALWKQNVLFLLLIIFAYSPSKSLVTYSDTNLQLVQTHTTVTDKWNPTLHQKQFSALLQTIDSAIHNAQPTIVLPESVFPIFLNREPYLLDALKQRAQKINIITGALYLDHNTPRNSTYIFTKNNLQIANKVLLVPFGESNPLPNFLSKWVNDVFYDGAIDYEASAEITDYQIDGVTYRNAICFEATSEALYKGTPKNMIVLSNNGWFTPSIEPTLQKLLLQYYNLKYGTTIYHAVNMSDSYVVRNRDYIKSK